MSLLTLYICEFITGGGLSAEALPISLLNEGLMMRDALLRDVAALNRYKITTSHDHRIAASSLVKNSVVVDEGQFESVFNRMLEQADIVWLIAPETDGILLALSERCYVAQDDVANVKFIGCGYNATLIGTRKSLCEQALLAANIFTLPVISGDDWLGSPTAKTHHLKALYQAWVAKPEDGAGCEGIRLFDDIGALNTWLKEDDRYLNYLLQPYQVGIHASFSMLCHAGKSWLLSCNQQNIIIENQVFKLNGVTINGLAHYWQRFETLARKIAKMLPDASGYLGVDVVIDEQSKSIYVIEINPRLTTSYVGLSESIGHNTAELIIDCVLNPAFKCPNLQRNKVDILC